MAAAHADGRAYISVRLNALRLVMAVVFFALSRFSQRWDVWAGGADAILITSGYLGLSIIAAAVTWASPRAARLSGYLVPLLDLTAVTLFSIALLGAAPQRTEILTTNLASCVLLLVLSPLWVSYPLIVVTGVCALMSHLYVRRTVGEMDFYPDILSAVILAVGFVASALGMRNTLRLSAAAVRDHELELVAIRQRDHALDNFVRVLQHLPHAVIVHRASVLISGNEAARRLLGWADNAPPRLALEGTTGGLTPRSLTDPGAPFEAMLTVEHDHPIPVEIANTEIELDDGLAALTIVRDLRERRSLENQAIQADRLATLGTLAASVAHEITNPLLVITSGTSWLARMPAQAEGDETREVVSDMSSAAQQLRAIAQDLRLLARRDTNDERALELSEVVQRSLRLSMPQLRSRARVVQQLEAAPRVVGNDARLAQVLTNLLVNAAQAIPEGKMQENTITIRLSSTPQGDALLEVSDTGSGISAEVKQRLFEPFFTTKPAGVGTGLGLAISRRIIAALHGTIDVTSEPGVGTTFRIVLPAAAEA